MLHVLKRVVPAASFGAAGAMKVVIHRAPQSSGVNSRNVGVLAVASAARPEPAVEPASDRYFPTPRGTIRTDWTREEVAAIYNSPFLELVHEAGAVHRLVTHTC